jgi:Domain of unknown function (DUF4190)
MTEPEQPPAQPGPIPEGADPGYPPAPGATPAYGPVPPQYAAQQQYGAPPGYPPAGYGYGYGYPTAQGGTNGLAIAAMICGICGFACLVPGLVGIVLGIVSLPQIKRNGQSGRGMAIAGIVLGALWIVVTVVVFVVTHEISQPLDTGGDGSGGAAV